MRLPNHIKFICIAVLSLLLSSCLEIPKPISQKNSDKDKPIDTIPTTSPYKTSGIIEFSLKKAGNPSLPEDVTFEIYDNHNIFAYLKFPVKDLIFTPTFVSDSGDVFINNVLLESSKNKMDLSKPNTLLFLSNKDDTIKYKVSLVPYTGLPLAIIHCNDEFTPTSKDIWIQARMRIDGMGIYDDFREMSIEVKRRGNATFKYPKHSWNIRLNSRNKILGMKKHKRWCLLANYRDRTLLRNATAFYIGQNMLNLAWTPHYQYSEIIFNGEYLGNYMIFEHIKVDKNRININEMTSDDITDELITGGYLIEMDGYYNGDNKFRTAIDSLPVNISSPDNEILTKSQFHYIESFINKTERFLANQDFDSAHNLIDVDSFVDFWIVQEVMGNSEPKQPCSCYYYKERNGKLYAGPIWDFDYSTLVSSSILFYREPDENTVAKEKLDDYLIQHNGYNHTVTVSIPNTL